MMRSKPSSRSLSARLADRFHAQAGAPLGRVARLLALIAVLLVAGDARALSFRADFVSSNYQTLATDTFSSLMLQHQAGSLIRSTVTTGLENISTAVYANGVTSNYSILMTTSFQAAVAGTYTFQVGTDWGRGGAAAVLDGNSGAVLSQQVITSNVWWAGDWNNASVFTTSATLAVGQSVTFGWVGFEDCCGGSSTVRFSVNGSGYQGLNQSNFQSFTMVPEPSSALLMGLGLLGLAVAGERARR
ncbi:MAG: CCXG family PEP-CTERM protein [Deltaproteobacteria bacterium]|nr:CCXG family PEP-CTERM protein [Deltaproteobacteria bacterium]